MSYWSLVIGCFRLCLESNVFWFVAMSPRFVLLLLTTPMMTYNTHLNIPNTANCIVLGLWPDIFLLNVSIF